MFETAIYTDCTPEESLEGYGGFDFQSVSDGLDSRDRSFIPLNMLHTVEPQWDAENDPLAHPETTRYLREAERFFFARGKSTGATGSGRSGNQLTQIARTDDVQDFAPNVPAQLHGAVEWKPERAGRTSQSWEAPVALRPDFELDSIWQELLSNDWTQEVLPSLITMVEDAADTAAPKKLVFIGPDLDEVMKWIALGTSMMGGQVARNMGYAAFVSSPKSTPAVIIGMHPKMIFDDLSNCNVVNLADQTFTKMPVSKSAEATVTWARNEEFFDARGLIELMRSWQAAAGTETAVFAAEALLGGGDIPSTPENWRRFIELIRALAQQDAVDELALYSDELCDFVSTRRLTSAEEFQLAAEAARFTSEHDLSDLCAATVAPALESLPNAPAHAKLWIDALVGGGDWTWPPQLDQEYLIQALAAVINTAPTDALPQLLTVAQPFEAFLDPLQLSEGVKAISTVALEDSAVLIESVRWCCGSEIRNQIRGIILDKLESHDDVAVSRLIQGKWDHGLIAAGDEARSTAQSLDGWLQAAAIARVPTDKRAVDLAHGSNVRFEHKYLILSGLSPFDDHDLCLAWLQRFPGDRDLSGRLLRDVEGVLNANPTRKNLKNATTALTGLRQVARDQGTIDAVNRCERQIAQLRETAPTLSKKISHGLRGAFAGKRGRADWDGS